MYGQVLFALVLRVHLTLIARYIYLDSSSGGKKGDSEAFFQLDDKSQLAFLGKARYILEGGMEHLRNHIECIVNEIMSK